MKDLMRVMENLPVLAATINKVAVENKIFRDCFYNDCNVTIEHYGRQNKNMLVIDSIIELIPNDFSWCRTLIDEDGEIKVRFKYLTNAQKYYVHEYGVRERFYSKWKKALSQKDDFFSLLQKTLQQKHRK